MRISLILLVGAFAVTAILLFSSIQDVKGSPSPKKRKGGSSGSSSSGSRASTSWSGSKPKSSKPKSSSGGFFGSKKSKGYKPSKKGISKKSFSSGKKWKKALAFGAGVYIGAKVLKKVRYLS